MTRAFLGRWACNRAGPNTLQVQKFELNGAPKKISDYYQVFAEFFVNKDTDWYLSEMVDIYVQICHCFFEFL